MYSIVFWCRLVVLLFFFFGLIACYSLRLMKGLLNSGYWLCSKAKKPVKRQADTKTQRNTSQISLFIHFIEGKFRFNVSQYFISHTGQYKTYPVIRRPSIFLDKSLPLPDLSRRMEGPLLTGYIKRGLRTVDRTTDCGLGIKHGLGTTQ